jgi:hypothetical protein
VSAAIWLTSFPMVPYGLCLKWGMWNLPIEIGRLEKWGKNA